MKKIIFVIAALLAIGAPLQADILARYDFTGSVRTSSDTDPNSTATPFNDGPGLTGSYDLTHGNPAPSLSTPAALTVNDEPGAVAANDYYTFTITPNAGMVLNLTTLTFDSAVFGNGNFTGTFFLRSSIDAFASTLGSGTSGLPTAFTNTSISLAGPSFQNLSSAISFRVYLFDSNNGAPNGDLLDNVILNGTTAVPEPSSLAMLVASAGLLFGVQRFRRKKS